MGLDFTPALKSHHQHPPDHFSTRHPTISDVLLAIRSPCRQGGWHAEPFPNTPSMMEKLISA